MRVREGFSLVESVVAMLILTLGLTGIQVVTSRYLNIVTTSDRRAEALQLVRDRLDQVRSDPAYDKITSRYNNVVEKNLGGLDGLERRTIARRVQQDVSDGGGVIDFTRVTVTVTGSGISGEVKRSITVGGQ